MSSAKPVPVDVHIGTEKTGSTAVQHYLGLNRESLIAAHGILTPTTLGIGSNVNLAAACQLSEPADSLRLMRSLRSPEEVQAYYVDLQKKLAEEISRKQPKRLLLSCENLSSRLKTCEEIQKLQSFLLPFASSIRIIVYLRSQEDMIVSSHTTKIRNGFEGRFNYPPRGRERPDAHYNELLARWASVFGEEQVTVRLFEKNRLLNADIVEDFCHSVEIPSNLERNARTQNESPNALTLELMRRMNAYVPHQINHRPNPLRGDLMNVLSMSKGSTTGPSAPPPTAEFLARFEAGNKEVARRWFSSDESVPETLFETRGHTHSAEKLPELTEEILLEMAAQLWLHTQSKYIAKSIENECLQGELLLAQGKHRQALAYCKALCQRHPNETQAAELLMRAQQAAGGINLADTR